MIAENPAPDNNTMETLIETNEQLSKAMNQHHRAVLSARKALGLGTAENGVSPTGSASGSGYAPPPGPPPSTKPPVPARKAVAKPLDTRTQLQRGSTNYSPFEDSEENPFTDPKPNPPFPSDNRPPPNQFQDKLGIEPYHPGFSTTQSYMGRQDSSVGKVTMHAAVSEMPGTLVEREEEAG
jgi:hypothetical protein